MLTNLSGTVSVLFDAKLRTRVIQRFTVYPIGHHNRVSNFYPTIGLELLLSVICHLLFCSKRKSTICINARLIKIWFWGCCKSKTLFSEFVSKIIKSKFNYVFFSVRPINRPNRLIGFSSTNRPIILIESGEILKGLKFFNAPKFEF